MAAPVLQGDQHATISVGESTTKTIALTVPALTNFLEIDWLAYCGDGNAGQPNVITAMRWNGVALTFCVRSEGSNSEHEWVFIYKLAAPAIGSLNLEIDFGSQGNRYGSDLIAKYWSGADATIGNTFGVYNGAATSMSNSISVSADSVASDAIHKNGTATFVQDGSQILVHEGLDIGAASRIAASYLANATAMGWTWGGGSVRVPHAGIEIKAGAAAEPASTFNRSGARIIRGRPRLSVF